MPAPQRATLNGREGKICGPGTSCQEIVLKHKTEIEERESILIAQRGLCGYCARPLNGFVFHKGRKIQLLLHWDHFIPFSFSQVNSRSSWVASCQVCNGIKSSLVFGCVEEAVVHIRERAIALGYSDEENFLPVTSGVWTCVVCSKELKGTQKKTCSYECRRKRQRLINAEARRNAA